MRLFVLLLAVLLFVAPATAPAQHVAFTTKLFKVGRCDAKLNVSQTGGFYGGYVPGYYPAGRYYWADPYGVGFAQPPVTTTSPTMYVDFTNVSNKVMKEVMWGLVANGRLVAEAKDVGTFSPGAEIKHKYGISANVFPLQTGLPQCVALNVTFADGTHIRNPNLPPRNIH